MNMFVETGFATPELIRDYARSAARATKLIHSRQIPDQLRGLTRVRPTQDWVLSRLVAIQIAVYSLDGYGETCWGIQPARLTQHWEAITREIFAVGISGRQVEVLTGQMRRYQEVEMSLRTGSALLTTPLERFYDLKTCDVRMSRAILGIVTGETLAPSLFGIVSTRSARYVMTLRTSTKTQPPLTATVFSCRCGLLATR